MRPVPFRSPRPLLCLSLAWILAVALFATAPVPAHARDLEDLLTAVVWVKTSIEPDGLTVATLGREREGSGVLIDTDGLVLTIGYLMVEARSAEIGLQDGRTIPATVVGYDHETGFGLLRAIVPPKVPPLELGSSARLNVGDPCWWRALAGLRGPRPPGSRPDAPSRAAGSICLRTPSSPPRPTPIGAGRRCLKPS